MLALFDLAGAAAAAPLNGSGFDCNGFGWGGSPAGGL